MEIVEGKYKSIQYDLGVDNKTLTAPETDGWEMVAVLVSGGKTIAYYRKMDNTPEVPNED